MSSSRTRTKQEGSRPTVAEGKAISDRVCDATLPLLFAKSGSDVGRLVEAALACASALERATEESA